MRRVNHPPVTGSAEQDAQVPSNPIPRRMRGTIHGTPRLHTAGRKHRSRKLQTTRHGVAAATRVNPTLHRGILRRSQPTNAGPHQKPASKPGLQQLHGSQRLHTLTVQTLLTPRRAGNRPRIPNIKRTTKAPLDLPTYPVPLLQFRNQNLLVAHKGLYPFGVTNLSGLNVTFQNRPDENWGTKPQRPTPWGGGYPSTTSNRV